MPDGQGFLAKCVLGREGSWGSPSIGDEILTFISESLNRENEVLDSRYIDGQADIKNTRNSSISVAGDIVLEAVYDTIAGAIKGMDSFFAFGLGAANFNSPFNEFSTTDQLDDSFTVGFLKKADSVWEAQGCKIQSLVITGSASGTLEITATIVGRNMLITGEGGIVNSPGSINGIVSTDNPNPIAFDDGVIRIGPHGGSLGGGDARCISEFTLTIDNSLSDPTFSTACDGNSDNARFSLEPVRDGFREVTLDLTFPRYNEDTFWTGLTNETLYQADLKFSRAGDEFNIYLPNMKVTSNLAPIGGPEIFPLTVQFRPLANNGINNNMNFSGGGNIAGSVGIETSNARTSAP